MKFRLGLVGLFIIFFSVIVFAKPNVSIEEDMNELMDKIDRINQNLEQKHKMQSSIKMAIINSEGAIQKVDELLNKLRKERDLEHNQLQEIDKSISKFISAIDVAKNSIHNSINKIYKQLIKINNNNSIISGHDVSERKRQKVYLTTLLRKEESEYQELQTKLERLNMTSIRIKKELERLDKELGEMTQHRQQLVAKKQHDLHKVTDLNSQISKDKQQLIALKKQQDSLNKLIAQIKIDKKKDVATKKNTEKSSNYKNSGSPLIVAKIENDVENNSPFFSRKLVTPVDAEVLVPFGTLTNGIRSNGVLFKTKDHAPIYAISSGKVLYVGNLAGFGQMIIIDNGDNHTSIYAGIVPKIKKDQLVSVGTIIANAGTAANWPMGGVYFELRHFGKPLNPGKLLR